AVPLSYLPTRLSHTVHRPKCRPLPGHRAAVASTSRTLTAIGSSAVATRRETAVPPHPTGRVMPIRSRPRLSRAGKAAAAAPPDLLGLSLKQRQYPADK